MTALLHRLVAVASPLTFKAGLITTQLSVKTRTVTTASLLARRGDFTFNGTLTGDYADVTAYAGTDGIFELDATFDSSGQSAGRRHR